MEKCSWTIRDTGFFQIKPPLSSIALEISPKTGKLLSVRREGTSTDGSTGQNLKIRWFELRLY